MIWRLFYASTAILNTLGAGLDVLRPERAGYVPWWGHAIIATWGLLMLTAHPREAQP